MTCVQLYKDGLQMVPPLGMWSRLSGVVKALFGHAQYAVYMDNTTYKGCQDAKLRVALLVHPLLITIAHTVLVVGDVNFLVDMAM